MRKFNIYPYLYLVIALLMTACIEPISADQLLVAGDLPMEHNEGDPNHTPTPDMTDKNMAISSQEIQPNQTPQLPQSPPTGKQIYIVEVETSKPELLEKVTFDILWPTYLPEGYTFQKVSGFSINGTGPILATDSILHYGIGQDQWLMIQQSTSIQTVSVDGYIFIADVFVEDRTVSIYENNQDTVGIFTTLYFERDGVSHFVKAVGLSIDEMLAVISGLAFDEFSEK